MMKRALKWTKWLSLSFFGLVLLLALLLGTVLFTHPGLKLLSWGAEQALPSLKVGQVQGALFPRFELQDVSFVNDSLNLDARVESLALAVNFRCFFDPKVCVDELLLQGVNVQMPALPASEQSPPQDAPALQSVSTPLPIFVNKVRLNQVELNILGHHVDWQSFATALSMQGDRLVIAPTHWQSINLLLAAVQSPEESAEPLAAEPEPQVRQDIVLPEIRLPLTVDARRIDIHDFHLTGEQPLQVNHFGLTAQAGGDQVNVTTLELDMPQVEALLSSQVTLSGDYPLSARLDVLLKQAEFEGQRLSLSTSGSVGNLKLKARLADRVQAEIAAQLQPLKKQLPFDISLRQVEAQWPLNGESDYQIMLPSLTASGSLERYRLALETVVSGKTIPELDIVLQGQGSLEQIDLEQLAVKTLGGELSGQIMANWAAPLNWQAELDLSHIQPGLQWPQAEGDISGQVATSGSLTEQGGWQISLPKLDINGILRGYPLHVAGQLDAEDRNGNGEYKLNSQGLVLSHGPNQLHAKGRLDKRWMMDLEVNVPEFVKSVPELKGDMKGSIALRGPLKQPDIRLDLALNRLNWQQQAQVESVLLQGDVSPVFSPEADLTLVAKNINYDDIVVDEVALTLSGDEQSHALTLDVISDLLSTSLRIEGRLQQQPEMLWQGALRRMQLSSVQGEWRLQRSTDIALNLAKQTADVQAHCWLQAQSRLCLSEDTTLGESGEAKLAVYDFDFAQVEHFIPKQTRLQGQVNAQLFARWAAKALPEVTLSLQLPPGQVEQALEQPIGLGWDSVEVNANLAQDTLQADWLLDVTDNGDLSGNVTLEAVSSEQPLIDGKLALSTFKLDFLAPLLGGGEYSLFRGNINTDLALSGNAQHPQVRGQLLLEQLMLKGEVTQVDVEQGNVVIDFNGHQADLRAGIETPDGKLEVTGAADWQDLQDWRLNAHVFARALNVDLPPMVKITVEPDMIIDVTPKLAKVTGDINLPWGRIAIEELPASAVGVSADQVLLDKHGQPINGEEVIPFNVETDVNIRIGDDFKLSAFGLKGNLRGKLNVTQKDKGPFIVGEVNIIDGSYRSFGQDLLIREGKILMNGPADQPYVSFKAVRNPDNTQDDVIAGVRVTGPASEPEVEIFSEPAMPQANALSYLLRGQNIDAESGGNAMTTTLIGLSLAKSGQVVGEIGEAFGVQDLQLDTAGSGDDSQVTVSGYILPGLQVKYGVGIFNSMGEFTVRYRLMKDLYLEAVSGVDSAVDLLYQFEFD
ncbi:translocation/assembly module TamB domain-containing protein [Vibrio sp. CAU 1672]|uniref:autotransporter assembly complex protein TamB n=1 Tax=Vibrio sp. CAU 1672 TaxID=3032594 RepID=UPI0023DCE8B8|nr:translocation/assembly module TamB domain-containing protein [Vibrio sp. CAU 1672]MDF2153205.1 translocation/assembly module TamB [Vibrio sp. CAU 1672]